MKKMILIFLLVCLWFSSTAQKKLVDTAAYREWQRLDGLLLSNNSAYASSDIAGSASNDKLTLVIRSVKATWKKEIKSVTSLGGFSQDNRYFSYLTDTNTLNLLLLGTDSIKKIPFISEHFFAGTESKPLLIYRLATPGKKLSLLNLATGQQQTYTGVNACFLNKAKTTLLLEKDTVGDQTVLQLLDLKINTSTIIWTGSHPDNFQFNEDDSVIAFTGQDSLHNIKQVWWYKIGKNKAFPLSDQNGHLEVVSIRSLDQSGSKLFYTVNLPTNRPKADSTLSSVDVYSYKDPKLQSEQLLESQQTSFTSVYNLAVHSSIRLEEDNEHIIGELPNKGDWVLVEKIDPGDPMAAEWNWNKNALCSVYLVSMLDGTRKCICPNKPFLITNKYTLSPTGKYVIYYNPYKKDYYSYTVANGAVHCVTKGLKADWTGFNWTNETPISAYANIGIAGWTANDNAVWLYSRYDLIRADPSGKNTPVNITNGYGAKHQVSFDTYYLNESTSTLSIQIILHFVDQNNKNQGFCRLRQGRDPLILSNLPKNLPAQTFKAYDGNNYAIGMEDEKTGYNYYLTRDFKKFIPLTNFQPAKDYNWLTSQLVTWKTPDGKTAQGILYKPANFDPKKRYPVIFHYYERLSHTLHSFYTPQYQNGTSIDIPTYVSDGYLVFIPDIHYKVGYPGKSALNTIVSGAKYLSHFPWVDTKRMGLMGHSFGGFETNYVITHSHLFAAAVSMSGMTDFVSAYGSIIGDGTSRQRQYELYRDRIGATLWQRRDLYIDNSPVFKADNVTTPVLLMANKKDKDVPYEQGVEFFTALRRLGKKAWMLQYDNGGHGLTDGRDDEDYSTRSRQFFDYYLKGIIPPTWMTQGVPASKKQIDSGFEPDSTGAKP